MAHHDYWNLHIKAALEELFQEHTAASMHAALHRYTPGRAIFHQTLNHLEATLTTSDVQGDYRQLIFNLYDIYHPASYIRVVVFNAAKSDFDHIARGVSLEPMLARLRRQFELQTIYLCDECDTLTTPDEEGLYQVCPECR